jgi:hypothetical protein
MRSIDPTERPMPIRLLLLAGACLAFSGCRLLPMQNLNTALDPRSLSRAEGAPPESTMAAAARPARSATAPTVPAIQPIRTPDLQPISDDEALAGRPTPLLDEALARARALESPPVSPQTADNAVIRASAEVPTPAAAAAPPAAPSPPGPAAELVLQPPPADAPTPELQATSAIALAANSSLYGPDAAAGVLSASTIDSGEEGGEPAAAPADAEVTQAVTESTTAPETTADRMTPPAPLPPAAATAQPTPTPATTEGWDQALARLSELARQEESAAQGQPTEAAWHLRTRLLEWMARPAGQEQPLDGPTHPLWPVALEMMSAAETPTDPDQIGTSPRDDDRPDARRPLAIDELALCQKVRGFGHYETLDTTSLRAGQTLTLYCELSGVEYDRTPENTYHSRIGARLELVAEGQLDTPVWTRELGTADDSCRRRRRDYYVNYRVVLPDPATLPPGRYRLRLIQHDLLADASATSEIPIAVLGDTAR